MSRSRRAIATALPFLLMLLVAGTARAAVTFDHSFGSFGAGPGQLNAPTGVAINEATGDVYVVDRENFRVERFDHEGNFISMWGRNVNATTNGSICTAASGDSCQAGQGGGGAGFFNSPRGIAVDNSDGPAAGSVYVQDADNNRVQRFTEDGQFVLAWGKGVDATTGGNICTQASGDTCTAGEPSGNAETTPPIPSADGLFSGWGGYYAGRRDPDIATDGSGYVYVGEGTSVPYPRVQKFDPSGAYLGKVAPPPTGTGETPVFQFTFVTGLAANVAGEVFLADVGSGFNPAGFKRYEAADFSPTGDSAVVHSVLGGGIGVQRPAIDPSNGFVFGLGTAGGCKNGSNGIAVFEFHPTGQQVDCTVPSSPAIGSGGFGGVAGTGGIATSADHRLYVADPNANKILIFDTPVATPPGIGGQRVGEITSTKAVVRADVAANLGVTTYHVEYGQVPCSEVPDPCSSTAESGSIGAAYAPTPISGLLTGLEPATTYFYRVVATNDAGTEVGPDMSFTTYRESLLDPTCPNNLARQQTGASLLLDCRAYELVSAENQGGYDVTSDLVPGQEPFEGFPMADDRALYSVHNGGIPGTGKPTNRGPDPYVATREAEKKRWSTKYVGVPVDVPSASPFSSTVAGADASLDSFAFDGPEMCEPCFADGSAGIPVRTPDGGLEQGMAGSMPVSSPEPAGLIRKPLSRDGSHFVFGSEQQFEPAGNPGNGNVTIYDRDLGTGTTQVASTLPGGQTIADGSGVAELDVSGDGSRILIGDLVSTDSEGNRYWDLYMHVGNAAGSLQIYGGSEGALYNGMTSDGSQVLFSTREALAGDTDSSADLYRATVNGGAASIERVSTGSGGTGGTDACDPAGNSFNPADWNTIPGGPTDCSTVAVGGGGGIASQDGAAYFLSPELLDGGSNGIAGAPNLYRAAPEDAPEFVTTLESSATAPLKPSTHPFEKATGSFANPEGVAFDAADGSYYVLDNLDNTDSETVTGAYVQKFKADGSVDTGFGSGGKIDGTGSPSGKFLMAGWGEYVFGTTYGAPTEIAVDNDPSSPSYGDLYVPDIGNFAIKKFDSEGNYLSQIEVGDYITGIAVNQANGDVYASGFFGAGYVWDANGVEKAPSGFAIPPFTITSISVDSTGRAFVSNGEETHAYAPDGTAEGTIGSGPAYTTGIDPADDHLYINHGDHISEYDPAGNAVGEFGTADLSESIGVAISSGRVLASNGGSNNVALFGTPVTPPDSGYDNPLVLDSVRAVEKRETSDFQTTPDGRFAAFPSSRSLTGKASAGRYEIFRDAVAAGGLTCVSCNPTGLDPTHDSSMASNGLSLTDDGRVFFTTGEPLVRRDSNEKKDAYEWSDGRAELISTGQSAFDSGLLSVTSDGTNAFFFTRETLTDNDANGTLMKLYTAREEGGFFEIPPPPACAASDECHGPSSQRPDPALNATGTGTGGNSTAAKPCKRGFVRKNGRCVKKKKSHRKHRRKRRQHRGGRHG